MRLESNLENRFFRYSKSLCWILVALTCHEMTAQNESINQDQREDSIFNEYIIDHKKRFNVKLEVGNDITTYNVVNEDINFDLKPNLNLRYAVIFSYKFLSIRIGIRFKP